MNEKARTRVGGPEDPREGLEAVVALRRTLEALEAAQAENAFLAGRPRAGIAAALGGGRGARCPGADSRGPGGGAGRERVYRGLVVGGDRGGVGGEQAGRAQKARQEDPGEVTGPAARQGGEVVCQCRRG